MKKFSCDICDLLTCTTPRIRIENHLEQELRIGFGFGIVKIQTMPNPKHNSLWDEAPSIHRKWAFLHCTPPPLNQPDSSKITISQSCPLLSNLILLSSLLSAVFSGIRETLLCPILLQLFINWLGSTHQDLPSSITTTRLYTPSGSFFLLFYAQLHHLPKYYLITMESNCQTFSFF